MPFTVTSKGQVTIPKNIRERLKIRPNDQVDFVQEKGRVFLVAVKTLKDLRGAVPARGKGDFANERNRAKLAVAKRVIEETR
jgi:AbrB family looped-hinge helix DNA binding protein